MKKIINEKKLIIILIIGIFMLLFIGSNKLIERINSNILSFLANNNYEEKDISEIANSMYVTMIDK